MPGYRTVKPRPTQSSSRKTRSSMYTTDTEGTKMPSIAGAKSGSPSKRPKLGSPTKRSEAESPSRKMGTSVKGALDKSIPIEPASFKLVPKGGSSKVSRKTASVKATSVKAVTAKSDLISSPTSEKPRPPSKKSVPTVKVLPVKSPSVRSTGKSAVAQSAESTAGSSSSAMPSKYRPPKLFVDPRYMPVSETTKGSDSGKSAGPLHVPLDDHQRRAHHQRDRRHRPGSPSSHRWSHRRPMSPRSEMNKDRAPHTGRRRMSRAMIITLVVFVGVAVLVIIIIAIYFGTRSDT